MKIPKIIIKEYIVLIYKYIDINMVKKLDKENKSDLSYIKNDKTLKKVEKYVDSKREKTSQEIIEKKSKRPATQYQEADLEVMISRISNESQPKKKKRNNKWVIYLIYAIIMIAIVISCIKFFMWNLSQISEITR